MWQPSNGGCSEPAMQLFESLKRLKEPNKLLAQRVEALFQENFGHRHPQELEDYLEKISRLTHHGQASAPVSHKASFVSGINSLGKAAEKNQTKHHLGKRQSQMHSLSKDQSLTNLRNSLASIKTKRAPEAPANEAQPRVPKIRVSTALITPQNESLVLCLFEFLASASYPNADAHFRKVVDNLLFVCAKFEFEGYENIEASVSPEELRVRFVSRVSEYLFRILTNSNITHQTQEVIRTFAFHNKRPIALNTLITKAIAGTIDDKTQLGKTQLALLVAQAKLIPLMPEVQRTKFLQMIMLKGMKPTSEDQKLDFHEVGEAKEGNPAKGFDPKLFLSHENKHVLLLVFTQLLRPSDFDQGTSSKDQTGNQRMQNQQLFKFSNGGGLRVQDFANPQFVITKEAALDLMTRCLKAVQLFFEGQKKFQSLVSYLQLAFRIFACMGTEGCSTVLGNRTPSEFVIYFLVSAVQRNTVDLEVEHLQTFINLYVDSIEFVMLLQAQGRTTKSRRDSEMVGEALNVLAVFLPLLSGQNKRVWKVVADQFAIHLEGPNPITERGTDLPKQRAVLPLAAVEPGGSPAKLKRLQTVSHLTKTDMERVHDSILAKGYDRAFLAAILRLISLEIAFESKAGATQLRACGEAEVLSDSNYEDHLSSPNSPAAKGANAQGSQSPQRPTETLGCSKFISSLLAYFAETDFNAMDSPCLKLTLALQQTLLILKRFTDALQATELQASLSLVKKNVPNFVNKVFLCAPILLRQGSVQTQRVFEKLIQFVVFDVSYLYVKAGSLAQQTEDFEHLITQLIVNPLSKQVNKTQSTQTLALVSRALVNVAMLCQPFKPDGEEQKGISNAGLLVVQENLEKVFHDISGLLPNFHRSHDEQQPEGHFATDQSKKPADRTKDLQDTLTSLFDLLVLMGAPYCFTENGDRASDVKNSGEMILLWVHIMQYLQKYPGDHPKLLVQMSKLASVTPSILYDQDFSLQIRATNYRSRDPEILLNEGRFAKYPSLQQTLQASVAGDASAALSDANQTLKPTDVDSKVSKKELKEFLLKSINIKKEKQKRKEQLAKQQAEVPQEEQKNEEEFMQQQYSTQEERDFTAMQLNPSELIFIEMFVLVNEARIHFLKMVSETPKIQKTLGNCRFQTFGESIMVIFTNPQTDQDNLKQKLTEVVEVMTKEYIGVLAGFQELDLKCDDFRFLLENDMKYLIKASVNANQKMATLAQYLIQLYVRHFPLVLFNRGVTHTLLDCLHLLSRQLAQEYRCMVKPECLPTQGEMVFLPTDHGLLTRLLQNLATLVSRLYVYASIYRKPMADEVLKDYRAKLEASSAATVPQASGSLALELVTDLVSNLSLQRLKKFCIDRNLFDLHVLLLQEPSKAVDLIGQVMTPDVGVGAFFSQRGNEAVLSLLSPVPAQKEAASLKLSPFPIRLSSEPAPLYQKQLQIASIKLQQEVSLLNMHHFENSMANALVSLGCDLLNRVLKSCMKIDLVGQLQHLQKTTPTDKVLKSVAVKIQQLSEGYLEANVPKNEENEDAVSLNSEIKVHLRLFNFVRKVLSAADKEEVVTKHARKIENVVFRLFLIVDQLNSAGSCNLWVHRFCLVLVRSLTLSLEPSLVGLLQTFLDLCWYKQIDTRLLINALNFTGAALNLRVTNSKTLISKQKEISQIELQNGFQKNLGEVQNLVVLQHLTEVMVGYDNQVFITKFADALEFEAAAMHKVEESFDQTRHDAYSLKKSTTMVQFCQMHSLKFVSGFNQQLQAQKVLKFVSATADLFESVIARLAPAQNLPKERMDAVRAYLQFISGVALITNKLTHKKGCLSVQLKVLKVGLSLAISESLQQTAKQPEGKHLFGKLASASLELALRVVSKSKNTNYLEETAKGLKEDAEMIEDIKWLLEALQKRAAVVTAKISPLGEGLAPHGVSVEPGKAVLMTVDSGQLTRVKSYFRFGKVVSSRHNLVLVRMKKAKFDLASGDLDLSTVANLLFDQFNVIKFSLLANNFSQKQMLEIPAKFQPKVAVAAIRARHQPLLVRRPKFLQVCLQTSSALKDALSAYLGGSSQSLINRVFWKDPNVLDLVMREGKDNAQLLQSVPFRKHISLFRNRNVARMVKFVGFQFSGLHFLQSVALKPFYAGGGKITIFFLSQLFQSLRWDLNFQIHRLLIKKSAIKPSIAHNVIWFCRVECCLETQPQRKVPLPIEENLNKHALLVQSVIQSKMNHSEQDYFDTETNFLEKITSISGILKPSQSKDEKKAIIRDKLMQYNQEIPSNIYLPTNQKCHVVGIVTTSGAPMQSAARVPILVSFETQEYEGPDHDPKLETNRSKPCDHNDDQYVIKSLKQQKKLKQIQANLESSLLSLNAVSFDRQLADQRLLEELHDQIEKNQLVNFNPHNVAELYHDILSQFQLADTDWYSHNQRRMPGPLGQPTELEHTLKTHILQINHQPALKIKMSQYQFFTKPNPMSHEEADRMSFGASNIDQSQSQIIENSMLSMPYMNKQANEAARKADLRLARQPSGKRSKLNKKASATLDEKVSGLLALDLKLSNEYNLNEQSPKRAGHNEGLLYARRGSPGRLSRKNSNKASLHQLSSRSRGLSASYAPEQPNPASNRLSSKFQYRPRIFKSNKMQMMSNGIRLHLQFEEQLLKAQQRDPQAQTEKDNIETVLNHENEMDYNLSEVKQNGPVRDPNKPIKIVSCIFKVNDDLRQDILALQFIKLFQKIFKKCDLDLSVFPYKCISNRTGDDNLLGGIIEVVPNSNSRDQIGKAYEIDLYDYFLKKYGNESSRAFQAARLNFIKSLAAYSVVSFILQIKDRHNGNILIDDFGHIVHIDFGFIFDWSPGKDMRFESANFKMTKEFIKILGGSAQAEPYQLWMQKTIQGYLAVREHHREFMNLVELMIYSGFPCFKPISLQTLQQRFRMEGEQACLNQFEAALHMKSIIEDAHDKWTTWGYDMIQYKQNKIVF